MNSNKENESKLPEKLLFLELPYASPGDLLKPIIRRLDGRINIVHLKTTDTEQIRENVQWADVVWLERINQLTIHATVNIPQLNNKKVICRLHGKEVYSKFLGQVNWNVIDTLIFPTEHIQELFNKRFSIKNPVQTIIQHGIDTDPFSVPTSKANTKKLVLLGNLTLQKELPLCLLFFKELLQRDKDYKLFINGRFANPRLEFVAETMIHELNLKNDIVFTDYVEDLNLWFADKSHILSFSLAESFHHAIGEGMAAGMKPVIHAWQGSRDIWPEKFIFRDLDEFLNIVQCSEFDPQQYRNYVVDKNLDIENRLPDIECLLYYNNGKKEPIRLSADQTSDNACLRGDAIKMDAPESGLNEKETHFRNGREFVDRQCKPCEALLEQGRVDDSIRCYHNLLRSDPNNIGALIGLGKIRAVQKRHAEAEGLFKKTLTLDSNHFKARMHLAGLYRDMGQPTAAVKQFEECADIEQQDIQPLQELVALYKILGDEKNVQRVRLRINELDKTAEEITPSGTVSPGEGPNKGEKISFQAAGRKESKLPTNSASDENDFRKWASVTFSSDNPMGIVLRRGERIREYMNQELYWKQVQEPSGKSQLFNRLQFNFHELINGYFNTRSLAKIPTQNIKVLLDLYNKQTDRPISMTYDSEASFIFEIYRLLKRHIVVSDNHALIRFKTMDDLLTWSEDNIEILDLYRILRERLSVLYDSGLVSAFMVHGSLSTMDYTPFSDADTQIFLSDIALLSPQAIQKAADVISGANIHLKLFDPLQHHGFFISTDLDKFAYPESFLPIKTMQEAVLVMGERDQIFSLRSSDFENRYAVWHTGYFFRISHLRRRYPQNPFEMKRYLSRFSMMPVFYLELFQKEYPYKRDAFKMAEPYIPPELYKVFQVVAHIRRKWVPRKMVRFNAGFYKDVFDFSEWMLGKLTELDNEF